MDTLLASFVAVLLAEIGDRSQLLVILLVLRFPDAPGRVLAAAAVAGAISTGIGAAAGVLVHDTIPFRAVTLLVALSLLSAGAGAFARLKTPKLTVSARVGPFMAALAALLAAGIGDKTQFLAFALAARGAAPVLATLGATAAVVAAAVPAAMLGRRFVTVVPLRPLRIAIGVLMVVAGVVCALDALRLL